MKRLNLTLLALLLSFASFATGPIMGTPSVCMGSTTALGDTSAGGTWSSATPSVATVNSSGVVTGISVGTAVISYDVSGVYSTLVVTVNAIPGGITGPSLICGSTPVTEVGPGGGTWSSSSSSIVTIGASSGIAVGAAYGTATLTYTISTGCMATKMVTVSAAPVAYTVVGGGGYCTGGTGVPIGLSSSNLGTTYQLYNGGSPVGSAISGTGSSLSFGSITAAGTYSVEATTSGSCSAAMTGSATISVYPLPNVYTVTGGGSYCAGGTGDHIGLANSDAGITYQLYGAGVVIGAAMAGTGSPLDFGLEGTAGIYTVVATDPTTGCLDNMSGSATITISALPSAYAVTGGGSYCAGGTGVHIGLTYSVTGISYQLMLGGAAVGFPVAGSASSVDFGLQTVAGTYTVVGTNTATGCTSNMTGTAVVTITPLPTAYTIGGSGSYCAGSAGPDITLSGSTVGVDYELMSGGTLDTTIAGTGGALDFGSRAAGTYTISAVGSGTTCTSAMIGSGIITVSPAPAAELMTGGGSYCAGGTGVAIGLAGSNAGVNYTLYNGTTAVTTAAGTGSTLSFGSETAAGIYTVTAIDVTTSCAATMTGSETVVITTTVTPTVAVTATPGTTVCTGTSVSFTTTITNGGSLPTYQWTLNGIVVGSSSSSYPLTPVDGDVIGVTMTSSATCATPTTATTSVTMTVSTPTVTATSALASCGGVYTLNAAGASTYVWTPGTSLSCPTCASTTSTDAPATIVYTVTGTDTHGCTATATATANFNRIAGHVLYTGGSSSDVFKVWLIQFNSSDSTIVSTDSVNSCMDGGIPYYEFYSAPSGSYMIKAKMNGTTPGTSGWIPTYSYSSAYWYGASSLAHTTMSDTMNVNMIYGTVPPGPGFIGGYISSGAGRGTSGDVPAVGMIVYLEDASSHHVITYVYTDASGNYSFTGLSDGSYIISPENFTFYTTPSSVITLTTGSESISGIDFKQHTTTGTITPIATTLVPAVATEGFSVYPNPTSGNLNIQWSSKATGTANVIITDMTGREMTSSVIDMNTSGGQAQLSLTGINDGIYFITVISAGINYSGKIAVQH